jgi:hypothetical protein
MQELLMAATWGGATRLGMLLGLAAGATTYQAFTGVWALDPGRSDLGQCRAVEAAMLRVEHTSAGVTVVELVRDEFGGHVMKRGFTIFRRTGNTVQLQAEQQPSQIPVPVEQWTLSSDGAQLLIRRPCGQSSVQRLVFRRSTTVLE